MDEVDIEDKVDVVDTPLCHCEQSEAISSHRFSVNDGSTP